MMYIEDVSSVSAPSLVSIAFIDKMFNFQQFFDVISQEK